MNLNSILNNNYSSSNSYLSSSSQDIENRKSKRKEPMNSDSPTASNASSSFSHPEMVYKIDENEEVASNEIKYLKEELRAISIDHDNRLVLHMLEGTINTKLEAGEFNKDFAQAYELPIGSFLERPIDEDKQLFYLKKISKKPYQSEVKIYVDTNKKIGSGKIGEITELIPLGSGKKKVIKRANKLKYNPHIVEEGELLSDLHFQLPNDPVLNREGKNKRHLGILDEFTFSGDDRMWKKFVVGAFFDGNATALKVKKISQALTFMHHLAFGLEVIISKNNYDHDIKPENILFEINRNFYSGFRVVLADLSPTSAQSLRKDYLKGRFDFNHPFGTCTTDFMQKKDIEEITNLGKKLPITSKKSKDKKRKINECEENINGDVERTIDEIFHLRQKNMVHLLGQTFSRVIVQEWSINLFCEMSRKFIPNKLVNKMRNECFSEKNDRESQFCEELAQLIMHMTEVNYQKRPTSKEVLFRVVDMMKKYDPEQFEIIDKNRWTAAYTDW